MFMVSPILKHQFLNHMKTKHIMLQVNKTLIDWNTSLTHLEKNGYQIEISNNIFNCRKDMYDTWKYFWNKTENCLKRAMLKQVSVYVSFKKLSLNNDSFVDNVTNNCPTKQTTLFNVENVEIGLTK